MTWEKPKIGDVISFSFLWKEQERQGQVEGSKDRPCSVVIMQEEADGRTAYYVLPITSAPQDPSTSIELDAAVKGHIGLDPGKPAWLVGNEVNRFEWPGPDIRAVPGKDGVIYGKLPRGLVRDMATLVAEHFRNKTLKVVKR
jgi:hypothetical protein